MLSGYIDTNNPTTMNALNNPEVYEFYINEKGKKPMVRLNKDDFVVSEPKKLRFKEWWTKNRVIQTKMKKWQEEPEPLEEYEELQHTLRKDLYFTHILDSA